MLQEVLWPKSPSRGEKPAYYFSPGYFFNFILVLLLRAKTWLKTMAGDKNLSFEKIKLQSKQGGLICTKNFV